MRNRASHHQADNHRRHPLSSDRPGKCGKALQVLLAIEEYLIALFSTAGSYLCGTALARKASPKNLATTLHDHLESFCLSTVFLPASVVVWGAVDLPVF